MTGVCDSSAAFIREGRVEESRGEAWTRRIVGDPSELAQLDARGEPHYAAVMISDAQLMELSAKVGAKLKARRRYLVTSESCTGGWIGKVLTDISGSSDWYRGGVIVYSNALKEALVGVKSATLVAQGAVSEATAREMAIGALDTLGGDLAVAV